jgi:DUF2946 family protein
MDDFVIRALARWPDVPAVYGWLSLDRRGHWRLQDEPVRHAGLAAFISRNYAATERGEWFFQNGPQRVFAALDYTPWVLRWSREGGLSCHTGEPACNPGGAWLDEDGNLLIAFAAGVGLVSDQDLPALVEHFSTVPKLGANDGPEAIEAFLGDPTGVPLWLHLATGALPVSAVRSAAVPDRFDFKPKPMAVVGSGGFGA